MGTDIVSGLVEGLGFHPLLIVVMFLLKTLTLLFSMIVASHLTGGIDFGSVSHAVAKGTGLLTAVTLINLFDCGILLAGPVWFFGLMFLFDLDVRQARILTSINWGMSMVWKALLLILMFET